MNTDKEIKIIGWNTWSGVAVSGAGETLVDHISALAHTHDIVSLYEVHYADNPKEVPRFDTSPIQKDEIGPYHLTLGNEICASLHRTHTIYFTSNFNTYAHHDRSPAPYKVRFGNMLIVRKKRFTRFHFRDFISYGNGELNTEVVVKGAVTRGQPASRSMQVYCVEHKNLQFRFVFLHGIWTHRGKVDCPARVYQNSGIEKGVRLACTRNGETYRDAPTVLMGDLNYTDRMQCFNDLLNNQTIFNGAGVNLNSLCGIAGSRTSYYQKPEQQADFTLMSSSILPLLSSYTMEDAPSDHMRMHLVLNS